MAQSPRAIWVLIPSIIAFAAGYGVASHRQGRADPPSRAVRDAVVPPGIAEDLRAALISPDLFDRTTRIAALLAPLGPEALDPVRASFDSVLLDNGDVELVLFAEWWARFDPAAAFAWARDNRTAWHPAVVAAVTRAWARQDPVAARDATVTVDDEWLRQAAFIALVRGWEESGRDGLLDFLAASPPDSVEFNVAIDTLVRGIMLREGTEAAMDWADSLPQIASGPSTGFRSRALARVARALAELDPNAAAKWVELHLDDLDVRDGGILLFRVGVTWARVDGQAAMNWLGSLRRDHVLTDLAVQETFRAWFSKDREAASAWIEQQPVELWLDPALETYATMRGGKEPEYGLQWVSRISDETRRQGATVKIAANWLLEAPVAARVWLEQAEIDDATRERIESMAQHYAKGRERQQRLAQQRASHEAARAQRAAAAGIDPAP